MQSSKVLAMLEQGRIDELKLMLQDEIYRGELKKKPGAKQRYMAMRKYFGYVKSSRPILLKPCAVEFDGEMVTSFCNSYSLILTKESCGFLPMFTEEDGVYPTVTRMLKRDGVSETADLSKVMAEAKRKGYKLTKTEVNKETFVLRYKNTYYRLGLVDASYSIISDGGEVNVYHSGAPLSPITIENNIGVCMILPVKRDDNFINVNGITIIDLITE